MTYNITKNIIVVDNDLKEFNTYNEPITNQIYNYLVFEIENVKLGINEHNVLNEIAYPDYTKIFISSLQNNNIDLINVGYILRKIREKFSDISIYYSDSNIDKDIFFSAVAEYIFNDLNNMVLKNKPISDITPSYISSMVRVVIDSKNIIKRCMKSLEKSTSKSLFIFSLDSVSEKDCDFEIYDNIDQPGSEYEYIHHNSLSYYTYQDKNEDKLRHRFYNNRESYIIDMIKESIDKTFFTNKEENR